MEYWKCDIAWIQSTSCAFSVAGIFYEVRTVTDSMHRGKHISYQRGKRNTTPGTSLLKLEGVDSTDSAQWYAGKRVAYVYRAQRTVRGSKIRVIWGKITRPHGACLIPTVDLLRLIFYRQLRCCPRQVQVQDVRCFRPRHALPFVHIISSARVGEGGGR
jgi:ribosomal protein L35AE/L33A